MAIIQNGGRYTDNAAAICPRATQRNYNNNNNNSFRISKIVLIVFIVKNHHGNISVSRLYVVIISHKQLALGNRRGLAELCVIKFRRAALNGKLMDDPYSIFGGAGVRDHYFRTGRSFPENFSAFSQYDFNIKTLPVVFFFIILNNSIYLSRYKTFE